VGYVCRAEQSRSVYFTNGAMSRAFASVEGVCLGVCCVCVAGGSGVGLRCTA
jgi:hypothetical protein